MTPRSPFPARRARVLALGGLVAACLTLGVAACSSDTERLADRSGETAATTPTVLSVDAPLNQGPTDGQDGADSNAADPLVTGADTETNMTSFPDYPESKPEVSTAGPIAPAGNIDEVVPEVPVTSAPPVGLTDTADFGGQVTARISEVKAVDAKATVPGEVSGPGISVTVEIKNGSSDTIGLDSVTVTVTDAAGNPANSITDGGSPLHDVLMTGESASGTYVFSVPSDQRNPVTITVAYSTGAPTLVFTGEVAGG